MQKVMVHAAGGHDKLRIETHPDPLPGPGEVSIDTTAVGVNYADCVVRMGLYSSARKFVGWPITPGFEAAGHVHAVGAGVRDIEPGAPVFAITRFGGYATRIVVPRHQVFALPSRLTLVEAAGFPAVFMTAYYALFELAHPRAGNDVLVHSAAGGVGGALLQLARIAGLRTVGVVGASHKVEAARAMGANVVIDKSREALWPAAERAAPAGYHVVLDANGVATLRESYRHLASPGKLVVYGFHSMLPRRGGRPDYLKLARDWLRTPRFNPLALTTENRSVLAFNLSYLFEQKDLLEEAMRKLLEWVEQDRIVAPPVTRYPFARVADAHRDLESGATFGKLVLIVE